LFPILTLVRARLRKAGAMLAEKNITDKSDNYWILSVAEGTPGRLIGTICRVICVRFVVKKFFCTPQNFSFAGWGAASKTGSGKHAASTS